MSISVVFGSWALWLGVGFFLLLPALIAIALIRSLYYVYLSKQETPGGVVHFLFFLQGIQHEFQWNPWRASLHLAATPVVLGLAGLVIGLVIDNFVV